jgi:hypothetical protein
MTATTTLAAKVRTALGLPHFPAPRPEYDETDARVLVWSIRELEDVYARTGGTVTAREREYTLYGDITYPAIEVTVTVDLEGLGPVQVFTDWEPAAEVHGLGLSVVQAIGKVPATV